MSMIGNFRLLRPERLAALQADPETISDFLYPEEDESDEDEPPEDVADLDIDKAWHGIHFLLTGSDEAGTPPLDFILGGHPVGDEDVGYGPARAFTHQELQTIVRSLEPLTPDLLRARFDPRRMQALEIYPDIWSRSPAEDDTLGYLLSHYQELKRFLAHGAQEGFALLVYLN